MKLLPWCGNPWGGIQQMITLALSKNRSLSKTALKAWSWFRQFRWNGMKPPVVRWFICITKPRLTSVDVLPHFLPAWHGQTSNLKREKPQGKPYESPQLILVAAPRIWPLRNTGWMMVWAIMSKSARVYCSARALKSRVTTFCWMLFSSIFCQPYRLGLRKWLLPILMH
ncbi:Uncharacterised protein [Yersinia enterocolitica]|nr:Uncharacterised protein [Yersinia enterocolitica]